MKDALTIEPGQRTGTVCAPPSKSMAHRLLICAALSDTKTVIKCDGVSEDICATIDCLSEFLADFSVNGSEITVKPLRRVFHDEKPLLRCRESGSTLRFILPVAGAMLNEADLIMEGRLYERPMSEFEDLLRSRGMDIKRKGRILSFDGRLLPGVFSLPGNISSQFFSGLMFALPCLSSGSLMTIEGKLESVDYLNMTEASVRDFGISFEKKGNVYHIPGGQRFVSKGLYTVEGDHSNAAFFLCAGALSEKGVTVTGLSYDSLQGDKRITDELSGFGALCEKNGNSIFVKKGTLTAKDIDASMIPDLVPAIAVTACACAGESRIYNAKRLRLKESDRIKSTVLLIRSLGGSAIETEDGMIIKGEGALKGGTVSTFNDHRIAMAAALAACICKEQVTVKDPGCVSKSFPAFWDEFKKLKTC